MDDRIWILDVPVNPVTADQALDVMSQWLQQETFKTRLVFTPNAEIIALAQDNPELKTALAAADLTVPDGIGVVWAARRLGTPLKERVPGIELLEKLMALAATKGYTVYFLGSRPGVAEEAKRCLQERYSNLQVVGTHHGYFDAEEEAEIFSQLETIQPDILVVALGAPKQELWLMRHGERLPVKVALGVGGSLDVMSGQVKRAPPVWQRLGLEWLYRILKEPKRLKRAGQLPRFVWLVFKKSISGQSKNT